MAIIKWDREFPALFRVPRILEEFEWPEDGLNMYETDDAIVVEAPVPGVPEKNVEVTVEDNVLSIKADYEETREEKARKKVVYKEARKRSFNYVTTLPKPVKGDKAEAVVENGVLTVTIPKAEEAKPKRIKVKKKK